MTKAIRERIRRLQAILKDGRPKGKLEKLCIHRQIRDFQTGHERGLVWDEAEAIRAVAFFGLLRHWKGEWAGKAFELEPWQAECVVAPIFGWKKRGIGEEKKPARELARRYRTGYAELGKKSGKTILAAAIGLFGLVADNEAGAEVYSAATKRDQAKICFMDACNIVSKSPEFKNRLEVLKTSIYCEKLKSSFLPLSSDHNTMDGFNPHFAVIDELHRHKNRDIYDLIKASTAARRQPFVFSITTAGVDRHSVCREEHEYSIKLLEGIFQNDSYFVYICAADKKDDWANEKIWGKANPNIGISPTMEFLRERYKEAKEKPSSQNTFKRFHLNLWTEQETRFIPMEKWGKCYLGIRKGGKIVTDPVILRAEMMKRLKGQRCWAGLDLSTRYDLTAFVLVFLVDGIYEVIPYFWIPEACMAERIHRDRVPYDVWVAQGFVEATAGDIVDLEWVQKQIRETGEEFTIEEIAFDKWGAAQIQTGLANDGFKILQFGQGMGWMSAPMKELLALVMSGKMNHGNNPVLTWNASAVAAKQDASGRIMPVKPDRNKSANRIDGIVSLIMGLDRVTRHEGDTTGSVYDKRGILTLG